MMRARWSWSVAVLAASTIVPVPVSAQVPGQKFGELLKRIPDGANLLMLVDVDGFFASPLGQREKWREESAERFRSGVGLPPNMVRLAVASGVDLDEGDIRWRVGTAEFTGRLPDLPTLAAREGGFVEDINLAQAAWTPRDLYFVSFGTKVMGFVTPADRQAMAGWINGAFGKARNYPPGFADRAIIRAEAGSQLVLALDLQNSISPPLIKPWLAEMEEVHEMKIDPGLLAERLANVKSAFLQVDVKESIQGTLHVEFANDIAYAKPIAKRLVLAALEEYGAALPDLATWQGGVDGKAIVLEGRLSEESVRRVLSLAHPPRLTPERPSLAPVSPDARLPESPTREAAKNDVVQASQAYYRSVADMLDSLKSEKSTSYHGMKLWYERYAKQISELPILGVDKDLLTWGSTVERTLREMAYGINYNVQDRKYINSTSGGYYGGYYGVASNAPQQATRRQGEATLSVGLDGKWQALLQSVADVRRAMVEKYQVDF